MRRRQTLRTCDPVTIPLRVRFTSFTSPLCFHYVSVTRPLRFRYVSVTRPLRVRDAPVTPLLRFCHDSVTLPLHAFASHAKIVKGAARLAITCDGGRPRFGDH